MVELLSPNDNEVTANSGIETPDAPDTSDTTSPAESAIEESPPESEKSSNEEEAEKASKDSKKSNTYQAKSSVSRKPSSRVKEPDRKSVV